MNLGDPLLFKAVTTALLDHFDAESVYSDIVDGRYLAAVDKIYTLIQLDTYNDAQKLRLWQVRLQLLIFAGEMDMARKEAIALNNHLYLLENDAPTGQVLPLPRNNHMIRVLLLVLLLRLKSRANLALVNEIYKLTYQLRLKLTANLDTAQKLISASYEVMVLLSITQNFLPLRNMVISMRQQTGDNHPGYAAYRSNLALVELLLNAMFGVETSAKDYDALNDPTKQSFAYVTTSLKFAPEANYEQLQEVVNLPKNATAILVKLFAVWTLLNSFGFTVGKLLKSNYERVDIHRLEDNNAVVEELYRATSSHWDENVDKFYAL